MKTKIFLLSLLFLSALGCRKPPFPKPGEPTLDISHLEGPAMNLPWKVVKGTRLAGYVSLDSTPLQFKNR